MITVNLFDYNFGQSDTAYSVAYQTPERVRYVRGLMEFHGITLFTDEYINNPIVDQVQSKHKVGWLHEPRCLHPSTYKYSMQNMSKFDFIMTYDDMLLSEYHHKYRYSPYGGVWIDRKEWGIHPKHANISMLFGGKNTTDGHKLRHAIYDRLQEYPPQVHYYGLHGIPTDYSQQTKLKVLKDYRFSIVIETCRENGLFTEILLDCFAVGTIPIFWGAPDIDYFFNDDGIISFTSVDQLEAILPCLSEGLYQEMLPHARENLELVEQYVAMEDWHYKHYYKDMR